MVIPEKTHSNNPFVDNIIYYAKLIAMNCSIKDEEEALKNETKESLENGDILISCVESNSKYEMFKSIPKEILEKYITLDSNLNIYVSDIENLKIHLNSYDLYTRNEIYNNLSRIAREVYVDHFNIMVNYINTIGITWAEDNLNLYNNCNNNIATYVDLFDLIPKFTRKRIVAKYLNNYDNTDIDSICASLSVFQQYIDTRTDIQIDTELANISKAMREVFISHYDIMVERGFVRSASETMHTYVNSPYLYDRCKDDTATFIILYSSLPKSAINSILNATFNEDDIETYNLEDSLSNIIDYISEHSNNLVYDQLDRLAMDMYLENYQSYLNYDIYYKCISGNIEYYDLVEYLPKETQKMILNTQIEEYTNIKVYSENKDMLDSYLNTIPKDQADLIKYNINMDMRKWYPLHHNELNNYYRTFAGLPPVDNNGNVYEDTLIHSWDENTKTFKEFGDKFIKAISPSIYPDIHWKQNIYEFDAYDIGILNQKGILDDYIAACGYTPNDSRYKYIKYLADNKLNIYQCRKAIKFQLIGIPTIDDKDAIKRFVDSYTVNRDYCIRTVYSDAHKFQSNYYDKFMIIFILINTIIDMLADITTMIIDREVFDSRCIKWLFESFGVPYYSEIPLKYLRAMLKNLNMLLKYKSSTKNMIDICKLFGFSDVKVFGYYLFRERVKDSYSGEYKFEENNDISYDINKLWVKIYPNQIQSESGETTINLSESSIVQDYSGIYYMKLSDYQHYDPDTYTKTITFQSNNGDILTKRIIKNDMDVYIKDNEYNCFISLKDTDYFTKVKADTRPAELKFIKVPVDESLAEYKNNPNYIISYDEITYADEGNTWDGGRIHEELYQKLVEHEFNAVKTKYISVETVTDLTEQCFQVSYFYNMLFDNLYSEDALTVKIPYLKIGHKFRFMDIICYLFSLMYFYNDLEDNIMYSPTQILYVKGYNFNEALNEVLNDPKIFDQSQDISIRDNIFNINERIVEDNYNYREAFNNYKIKGFNLEVDIDELELWLNNYCGMSLDDFIVDDTLINFNQIITLRQFFSLNNSYYQKNIFKDAVTALEYNQILKLAYGITLYKKIFENDYDNFKHEYILESNYWMHIINSCTDEIYIINENIYITMPDGTNHAIYEKYISNEDTSIYNKSSYLYYYYNNGSYNPLFNEIIRILDEYNRIIFSTNNIYKKNSNEEYIEIIDNYLINQSDSIKYIKWDPYWIYNNSVNKWELNKNIAYIKVIINNIISYVKYIDAINHTNIEFDENDLWIKHSDGHFIKFIETDFYRTNHSEEYNNSLDNKPFEYNKEELYAQVDPSSGTDSDTDINGETRYFKKVSEYYNEVNWNYDIELLYFLIDDQYIPYYDLLSPYNCYIENNGNYSLVIDNYAVYKQYTNLMKNSTYLLILKDNYDYDKYIWNSDKSSFSKVNDTQRRYVYNSDTDYITVLHKQDNYSNTKNMIVVFNKKVTSSNTNQLIINGKYNPELTDGVWDENDWFYEDMENSSMSGLDIGMHGENIWYYRKPGSELIPQDDDLESSPVGSGFYMESTAYIGDTRLVEGEKYYMAFDIETNFTGKIQIFNTADNSVSDINDKVYEVCKGEKQHISQVFIANENSSPEIKFLIYDFNNYPINIGDYIILSNIRFIKAYSNNFISQDIPSYDKIQELYKTNEAIYKYLLNLMAKESDLYKYNIYKKIYDSLMLSKYNKEAFKIGDNKYAKTYTEFLENRDAILYAKLCRFKELDKDAMRKEIADEIIEVTYAIDDCVDTYSYAFLYSYFPAVSANYIQQYITKLINWFKSWKVHLLGINTIYKLGDPFENTVKILEDQQYRNKYDNIKSNVYLHDTVKINPFEDKNISGELYNNNYEFDEYTQSYKDCAAPKERVRIISTTANKIEYQDSDSELHLIFNDINTTAEVVVDNNMKINSTLAGFTTANENQLVMSTDENEQQAIISQIIDEINLHSEDYVDWRSILDE